jgi:hypothetical protein
VRASAEVQPCPRSYYFVCPENYLELPKVQQLLAWLREMAAAFQGPDSVPAPQPTSVAPRLARAAVARDRRPA